jgi:hypothetical protein
MRSPLRSHATGDRRRERWGVGDMVAISLGGDEPHSASAFERPERSALHEVFIIIGRGFSTGRSIETSVHPRSRRAELLTMKVTSTGDVSLDVLSELVPDLSPEIDLEVERAQYQFRTLEPPSFVTFLGSMRMVGSALRGLRSALFCGNREGGWKGNVEES